MRRAFSEGPCGVLDAFGINRGKPLRRLHRLPQVTAHGAEITEVMNDSLSQLRYDLHQSSEWSIGYGGMRLLRR